jgi:hypothetical protein
MVIPMANAPKFLLIGVGSALLNFAPSLWAETPAHAAIVKERETVLSQIVARVDSQRTVGLADNEALLSAKLALLAFRRDTAGTPAEKLRQQEQIVALHEEKLSFLQTRAQGGTSSQLDVLRATEALLAAKQLLEEMR